MHDVYAQRTLSVPAATFVKYLTTITLDALIPAASAESIAYVVPNPLCNVVPINDQSYPVTVAMFAPDAATGTE